MTKDRTGMTQNDFCGQRIQLHDKLILTDCQKIYINIERGILSGNRPTRMLRVLSLTHPTFFSCGMQELLVVCYLLESAYANNQQQITGAAGERTLPSWLGIGASRICKSPQTGSLRLLHSKSACADSIRAWVGWCF